ncbi:phenylalanine--tRNA ligase subunit alpha [Candidatus Woesearchaeota archaeon]|nr:phenylalanine--tRNA ligase subunit alpha [Candidatus Woesearchaeota archaeon]
MDIKQLAQTLHPLERKVLPLVEKHPSLEELVKQTGLSEVEVMRALQWLQNKGVLEIKEKRSEAVLLDTNGKQYLEEGLPEKRFLKAVDKSTLTIDEILKKTGLAKDELNSCLGILKGKAAIDLKKDGKLRISITDNGKKLLKKESFEEQFLKKDFPADISALKDEERFALENLRKRKGLVKTETIKEKSASLTELGRKLAGQDIGSDAEDSLTSGMLKTGSWKGKNFRRYDISINVPRISGGKRHFVKDAIDYVRKIWLELGFEEMTGPLVQTSFWTFDALFTAQDHPARDLQDTFFIKNPAKGKLPDKKIVDAVRKTHEDGWTTGSKGWQYSWDPEDARLNAARTHTTMLSALALAKLKPEDLPKKYFSVGRCFRNETLDYCHLFEFNQVEGIVVDENINFRNLLGYLKQFFSKLGYPKARFRPAYFPYTEPSVEIDVFHPVHKEWMELGGAGIFRPEVVKPLLGRDIPVAAWGPGFGRSIMEYYGITDIRDLYRNDLRQIRDMKIWMR